MNRRRFVALSASAMAGAALASPSDLQAAFTSKPKFPHAGYLGWITDLATRPGTNEAWPSLRLDEALVQDYRETFDAMLLSGFNEISVWGFYVGNSWPLEIESAVAPHRGRLVEKLIEAAHSRGIRVLSGLGLLSWGFEEIIRKVPKVSRGSTQVMCPHEEESWRWMEKIILYMFDRFGIDGVSMQSADQGRCRCSDCAQLSDPDYHALVNVRAAQFIRNRRPGKIIGLNSWGLRFGEPNAQSALIKMSEQVDYIIDVQNSSAWAGPEARRKLIKSLKCPFGTLGGPQPEPPQHWPRDRWFLPTLKRTAQHLRDLHEDGGRACEYFFHIRENPGDEASFLLAGQSLAEPKTNQDKLIRGVLEKMFWSTGAATDGLTEFFLAAEEAYFKHLPENLCGTVSLEPLVGDKPGPAVYLTERLKPAQRREYAATIDRLRDQARQLAPTVPAKGKFQKVIRCLDNVAEDLRTVGP